jgi:hypothetical protein
MQTAGCPHTSQTREAALVRDIHTALRWHKDGPRPAGQLCADVYKMDQEHRWTMKAAGGIVQLCLKYSNELSFIKNDHDGVVAELEAPSLNDPPPRT